MTQKYKATSHVGPRNTYNIEFENDQHFLNFFEPIPGGNLGETLENRAKLLAWAQSAKVGDKTKSSRGSEIEKVA